MKKTLFYLFFIIPNLVFAQTQGFFNQYIITNSGGTDTYNNSNGSSLSASGYCQGSTVLLGSEEHTFQNSGCNVSRVQMFYRIYPTGSPSGSWTALELYFQNQSGNGDKFWQVSSTSSFGNMTVNLINGLSAGNYTIERYYEGTASCNGGANFSIYDNNNNNNYTNTFTVNAIPSAPSVSINNATICSGNSATLTATGCAGTVTWSNGATGTTTSVSTTGSYTATCTVSGCTSGNSNTVSLTVNSTPSAPSITIDNSTICSNDEATLSATGCSGGTITWSNGATGTSTSI